MEVVSYSSLNPKVNQSKVSDSLTLFLFNLVSSHYKVSYTMAGRREGRTTMVRRLQVAARYPGLGLGCLGARYPGLGRL